MTKLIPILAAGAFALSLGSVAFAADPDPATTPADQAKQDQEYVAALKKCDSLQGDAKQKCIDQAKQKFNRM